MFSSTPAASLESSSSTADTLSSCSHGGISDDLINSLPMYSIDYKRISHPYAKQPKSRRKTHLPRIRAAEKIGICLQIKDTLPIHQPQYSFVAKISPKCEKVMIEPVENCKKIGDPGAFKSLSPAETCSSVLSSLAGTRDSASGPAQHSRCLSDNATVEHD